MDVEEEFAFLKRLSFSSDWLQPPAVACMR